MSTKTSTKETTTTPREPKGDASSNPKLDTPRHALLNAALGTYNNSICYFEGNEDDSNILTGPVSKLRDNKDGDLYLFGDVGTIDLTLFFHWTAKITPDVLRRDQILPPSAILQKGDMQIRVYRLKAPIPSSDLRRIAIDKLFEKWSRDADRWTGAIPLPGTDGWELKQHDAPRDYDPDQIVQAFKIEVLKPDNNTNNKQPGNEPPPGSVEALEKRINALDKEKGIPSKDAVEIFAEIAKITDTTIRNSLINLFKTKSDWPIADIKAGVRDASPIKREPAPNRDSDGRFILDYPASGLDHAIAIGTLTNEMLLRNLPASKEGPPIPRYTCMLGEIHVLRNLGAGEKFYELSKDAFCAEASKIMMIRRKGENGPGPKTSLESVITNKVHHLAYENLPQTPEPIRTPIIGPDGTLIYEDRWYPDLSLFLQKDGLELPSLSDTPTDEDHALAICWILYLVHEFRFCDQKPDATENGDSSHANAVAMIMTQFARRLFNGPSPLFGIEKPARGSGASLLGRIPQLIFDGRDGSATNYTDSEAEMQKELVTKYLEGSPFIRWDNVKHFNNRVILAALTEYVLSGRMLGLNKTVERINNFLFIFTANKPHLNSEMARRVCSIRIDTKTENPEDDVKYNRENPEAWVIQHRAELIWSILTIIRRWIADGKKPFTGTPLGNFPEWSKVMGGIVESMGLSDFLGNPRRASLGSGDAHSRTYAKDLFDKFEFKEFETDEVKKHFLIAGTDIIEGKHDNVKGKVLRDGLLDIEGVTYVLSGESVRLLFKERKSKESKGKEYWKFERSNAATTSIPMRMTVPGDQGFYGFVEIADGDGNARN